MRETTAAQRRECSGVLESGPTRAECVSRPAPALLGHLLSDDGEQAVRIPPGTVGASKEDMGVEPRRPPELGQPLLEIQLAWRGDSRKPLRLVAEPRLPHRVRGVAPEVEIDPVPRHLRHDVVPGVAKPLDHGVRQPEAARSVVPVCGQRRVALAGGPDPGQFGVQRVVLVVSLRAAEGNEDRLAAQAIEERRVTHIAVEVAHVEAVQTDDDEVHRSHDHERDRT